MLFLALFARGASVVQATFTPIYTSVGCEGTYHPGPDPAKGYDADPTDDCSPTTTADTVTDITAILDISAPQPNYVQPLLTNNSSAGNQYFSVPKGAVMGKLSSKTTLGLANGTCDDFLLVDFMLMSSETDYTNSMDPVPADDPQLGSEGTLQYFRDDDGGVLDRPGGYGGPGAAPPVNGLPAYVDKWPSFLSEMLDPDFISDGADGKYGTGDDVNGPLPPITPVGRYTGDTLVAGLSILINFIQFDADDFSGFFAYSETGHNNMYPHPLADIYSARLGQPTLIVLNDPTAPLSPGISDFCTPLGATTMLWGKSRDNPCTPNTTGCGAGETWDDDDINLPFPMPNVSDPGSGGTCTGTDEGNCTRAKTPLANGSGVDGTNTHLTVHLVHSMIDTDQDGFENGVDSCALTGAPGVEDPRTLRVPSPPGPSFDLDQDMLPASCDPNDTLKEFGGNIDQDTVAGGGWLNANDNCPKVPNTDQSDDGERDNPLQTVAPYGGPRYDEIGDACEPDYNGDTIVGNEECISNAADCTGNPADHVLSPTRADGFYEAVLTVDAACIGDGVAADEKDTDGDGWCDTTETNLGSLPGNSASTPEHYKVHFPLAIHQRSAGGGMVGAPIQVCNDGQDNDLDGDIDVPSSFADASFDSGCQPAFVTFPQSGTDTDGDGYPDKLEYYLGTGPFNPCGDTSGPDGSNSGWPADLDGNGAMGGPDINSYLFPLRGDLSFNKFGHPASEGPDTQRWDLDGNGSIGGPDFNSMSPAVTAPVARPPMVEGDIGFGNNCPFPATP